MRPNWPARSDTFSITPASSETADGHENDRGEHEDRLQNVRDEDGLHSTNGQIKGAHQVDGDNRDDLFELRDGFENQGWALNNDAM